MPKPYCFVLKKWIENFVQVFFIDAATGISYQKDDVLVPLHEPTIQPFRPAESPLSHCG